MYELKSKILGKNDPMEWSGIYELHSKAQDKIKTIGIAA